MTASCQPPGSGSLQCEVGCGLWVWVQSEDGWRAQAESAKRRRNFSSDIIRDVNCTPAPEAMTAGPVEQPENSGHPEQSLFRC